ncbi:hypothetical protein BJ138DRAFT_1111831 [Hygrophoropsis aurantiaca]|uniref:Uncharacterized protein n=1 Tax=Hygrophoropsis aurantiaca TaxID=72124 RepID=A0ACB8AIM5_9AGAM|nr:hypothetical protein BJ138DRAFT_1111831 [Hygrophoropsis aurantiaca]
MPISEPTIFKPGVGFIGRRSSLPLSESVTKPRRDRQDKKRVARAQAKLRNKLSRTSAALKPPANEKKRRGIFWSRGNHKSNLRASCGKGAILRPNQSPKENTSQRLSNFFVPTTPGRTNCSPRDEHDLKQTCIDEISEPVPSASLHSHMKRKLTALSLKLLNFHSLSRDPTLPMGLRTGRSPKGDNNVVHDAQSSSESFLGIIPNNLAPSSLVSLRPVNRNIRRRESSTEEVITRKRPRFWRSISSTTSFSLDNPLRGPTDSRRLLSIGEMPVDEDVNDSDIHTRHTSSLGLSSMHSDQSQSSGRGSPWTAWLGSSSQLCTSPTLEPTELIDNTDQFMLDQETNFNEGNDVILAPVRRVAGDDGQRDDSVEFYTGEDDGRKDLKKLKLGHRGNMDVFGLGALARALPNINKLFHR